MSDSVSAPGKAILFGEHAVVYGAPAIAIPLSQVRATARIDRSDQPLTIIAADLSQHGIQPGITNCDLPDPLARMAALTLDYLNLPGIRGEITISSAIPIASGLGSGAAVSAALGRAVAALHGQFVPADDLSALVYEVEKLHHGTPSGIDNSVVVYEKPVYFVRGEPLEFIQIKSPLHFILADTGIPSLTRQSVADVKALYQRRPEQTRAIFDQIGSIVEDSRACIELGDIARLGKLMTENHALLQALTVSLPELDRLVDAALSAGALGAKLSGGGRGGNIIALADENTVDAVRAKLLQAGAARVFLTTAGGDGIA